TRSAPSWPTSRRFRSVPRRRRADALKERFPMSRYRFATPAAACAIALSRGAAAPLPASAADVLLSGTVSSAAGEKMGGVTVSAKEIGKTIATTVFTDTAGDYVFPPLPAG